ncbi:accessory Sec system protein Asp2 [Paucisalibacillus globulus]|uniref:accessory Sec system protein Asp2 n=1 Tax=Paucisalibacillus globulus TaxID=351095 RepID=UPI000BB7CF1F|nr:accessory Sec system protein Asp2 [Paucisalibacillus globulus]
MDFKELTFNPNGGKEVSYVLEKGEHNTDYLVIVFSGFATAKSVPPYKYNYIRTLRQIDCNKLFILDSDGPRGSYYLGEAMSFDFEKSVIELINKIKRELTIANEHVITAGSSKGGSAALYYGLKYNFGSIITGAPQTLIADYVMNIHDNTADYMLGDRTNKDNIQLLNKVIYNALGMNNKATTIKILSSENDTLHNKHTVPFVKLLEQSDHPFNLIVDNDIKNHNEIAIKFPEFLVTNVLELLFGINYNKNNLSVSEGQFILEDTTKFPIQYNSVIEVKIKDKIIDVINFTKIVKFKIKNTFKYPTMVDLFYKVKSEKKDVYTENLGKFLLDERGELVNPNIVHNNKTITFNLNLESNRRLKFAYYIYKNGKIETKIMYQVESKLSFEVKGPGKYFIKYFILLPNKEKLVNQSEIIEIK